MGQERLPEQQPSARGCGVLMLHPAAGSAPRAAPLVLRCNTHGEPAGTTIWGFWPQIALSLFSRPLGQPWHSSHVLHAVGPGAGVLLFFTLSFLLTPQGTICCVVTSEKPP